MGSSQHKSPHHDRAFRRGLDGVTSAEISQSRRTQRCSMYFLVPIFEVVKLKLTVKRIGESARWADLTIRLIVKANSMSARML